MSLWLAIVLAGLVTFTIRFSFIGAAGRLGIPGWFNEVLRFVPIAALTALVWPDMLIANNTISIGEPRLLAGLIAAGVAWKTRNVLLTILVGMLALWILQWLK